MMDGTRFQDAASADGPLTDREIAHPNRGDLNRYPPTPESSTPPLLSDKPVAANGICQFPVDADAEFTKSKENDEEEEEGADEDEILYRDDADSNRRMGETSEKSERQNMTNELQYGIDDTPPWILTIFLGFQHYLTMFGATIAIPLILSSYLCMGDDAVALSEVISSIFFVSGIITCLQTTLGVRLPIVQGGTFSFLSPVISIMALPQWQCPAASVAMSNVSDINMTTMSSDGMNATTDPSLDDREVWQARMREVQGAIIVASLFEVLVGLSGVLGFMLKYIGPLTIAPTIALIGLSLFEAAASFCHAHWGIAILTMALVCLFSQYLRNINLPTIRYVKGGGCQRGSAPFFKLFPVILAILISWAFCAALTAGGVFPDDPEAMGYGARTDSKLNVLSEAKWFRIPYPLQWGTPTVSAASVLGMFAGVAAGMMESIGDYYACARLSGAPPPPVHAINRGIMVEGLGCVLAGLWGTGTGTTSYSENIGAIGITKVASRRVIQVGGILMIILGMLGKFGALFVTIPDPVVGGVFMVMFGMISAVGVSNLQFVDLNSSRNLFIFGFSLFFGLSVPGWISTHPELISTGSVSVDQVITVLLTTSMFVGGILGFFLDNTIPGTYKERGILVWREQVSASNAVAGDANHYSTYNLPCCMNALRRLTCLKYIPICPTYKGVPECCGKKDEPVKTNTEDAPYGNKDDIRSIELSSRREDSSDDSPVVVVKF